MYLQPIRQLQAGAWVYIKTTRREGAGLLKHTCSGFKNLFKNPTKEVHYIALPEAAALLVLLLRE